jgi:hypothetical protein
MSRPRFLADNDLNDAIVLGVLRREPSADFVRPRELRIETWPDSDIIEYAARHNWLVVSHDVNSMTAAAYDRLANGTTMNGLLLVHQRQAILPIIESLGSRIALLHMRGGSSKNPFMNLLIAFPNNALSPGLISLSFAIKSDYFFVSPFYLFAAVL